MLLQNVHHCANAMHNMHCDFTCDELRKSCDFFSCINIVATKSDCCNSVKIGLSENAKNGWPQFLTSFGPRVT